MRLPPTTVMAVLTAVVAGACARVPPSVLEADAKCRTAPPSARVALEVGKPEERVIQAPDRQNHTGVWLQAGGMYTFRASGGWRDSSIPTTPRGFRVTDAPWYGWSILWVGQPMRRMRSARWFALVGEVRDSSSDRRQRFVIGDSLVGWRSPFSGELTAFANDVNFKYGNNHGCLTLSVTRTQ